jgi:hypothetical protein
MAFVFGGGDGGDWGWEGWRRFSCRWGSFLLSWRCGLEHLIGRRVGRVRPSSYGFGSAVTALARRVSSFGRQVSPPSLLYSAYGELAGAGRWWA